MATPKSKSPTHGAKGSGVRRAAAVRSTRIRKERAAIDNRTPAQMMQKPKAPAQSKAAVNPFDGGVLSALNPLDWFRDNKKRK